ncbi:MAG TPA: hypothetical protein VF432_28820 [Thermoanaerobaculia bacterium]
MPDLSKLEQLASQFRVAPAPTANPFEPKLALQPPAELVTSGGLAIIEVTEKLEKVPGLATLYEVTYALKNVRFAPDAPIGILSDPQAEQVIGGMPVMLPTLVGAVLNHDLAKATLMSSEPGNESLPGVPGVLASFKAKVTPEVEKSVPTTITHAVSVESSWTVRDKEGNLVGGIFYGTPEGWVPFPTELARGAGELQLRSIAFAQLKSSTPEVHDYVVQARVRLSIAGHPPTSWVTLPSITVPIPTIPVPAILALFEHKDFGGRVCVCVPDGSLIGLDVPGSLSVAGALATTSGLLGAANPANQLVTTFMTAEAFQRFLSLAPQAKQVVFARGTRIPDLSKYEIEPGFAGVGRLTGEDMASSLICIAPPGTVVNIFADRDYGTGITKLQLTIAPGIDSPCGLAITELNHSADELILPDVTTYGGKVTSARPKGGYHDMISSLEWILPD